MSIEGELGELRGLMIAIREDVHSLKTSVYALQATQNQQKGGGKVLVSLGAIVGAAASMVAEAFIRK